MIVVGGEEAAGMVAAGASVLDVRGVVAYTRGHVPGAVRVSWRIGTAGGTYGELRGEGEAAGAFAAAGVDRGRTVLVVGDWDRGWGEEGRIAWDLMYLGHRDVHVLRDGMAGWGGGVEYLGPAVRAGVFEAEPRPEYRATRAEVEAAVKGGGRIVDVREPEEYAGAVLYGEARGGHIAGAVSVPWRGFLRGGAGGLAGTGGSGALIVHCTGGVRSAMVWVMLMDAGVVAKHYDGGWWDWSRSHAGG